MSWKTRRPYGPCDEPELTIIATLAHHHGAAKFEISSLAIPDMTKEMIWASLLTLEYRGYLRFSGAEAKLTGRGVEVGLFLFSVYTPDTQAAAGDGLDPHFPKVELPDWCI
jgi:hypothetical protein